MFNCHASRGGTLKKYFWILLFCLAGQSFIAQTLIKGHRVGETIEEFLQTAPAIQTQLATCHTSKPRPLTPDEVSKMSQIQVQLLAVGLPGFPNRKGLIKLAQQGTLMSVDARTAREKTECQMLVDALENGSKLPFTSDYNRTFWFFSDRKLVEIMLSLQVGTYDEVLIDLTKKIGFIPIESKPSFSNAYGATWNNRVAIWLSSELEAKLLDNRNPADPSVDLTVMTRAAYDDSVKQEANKPSPLD